ncbi:MAG: hypothetical protein J6B34_03265 [Clostridia bacterium]|nr:hypothetical protein [Clostridia bacterium]
MHIPSEKVYNKMRSEIASLWYVPANDGNETALIIKAPTPTIKAAILGCPLKLFFGKEDAYLCKAVMIEDVPGSPVIISGVQIEAEEHQALLKSVQQKSFPVFLFNEMDICVASSIIQLNLNDSEKILSFIKSEKLYSGNFDSLASAVLDCFEYTLDKALPYQNVHEMDIVEIAPDIGEWETNKIYFLNQAIAQKTDIAEKDEGEIFERTIWGSLESVFPTTLYKSPKVKIGEKTRELTDVYAYYEYGSFLIECKDLSVIQAGYERNMDKRIGGIQKQIKKALKQLVGATNAFKRGDIILDNVNKAIVVDRSQPPHCIVLITELITSGDWNEIAELLIDAVQQTGAFFHIIDFREFITLLKQSSGDPKLIDYNLMERCKICLEKRSVLIRGI